MDALFDLIPTSLKKFEPLHQLPSTGLTELALQQHLTSMASKNQGASFESFLGGGAYHRFIPPAVNHIASRSEFYTAYTPYQPEISQGTLQVIYEFQTLISELTGMDVTNASVYDGATALTESALMALRIKRRKALVYTETINPQYLQVLKTYVTAMGDVTLHAFNPLLPIEEQLQVDSKSIAAVITQQPDYFGTIHASGHIQAFCERADVILITAVDPVTLALLEPPSAFGAQIVCGDIQQFGNSVNFGGPYGGFVATTEKLMRQLPGRVVGRTLDKDGKVAYTLTLQTREQHIKREKATSNICTNQSLNMLKATIYLSLVGPNGLRQIAEVSTQRAHELASGILSMPGVSMRFEQPFLYEFAVRLPMPAATMIQNMAQRFDILAGIDMGRYYPEETNTLLIAVTEMNSPESIQKYLTAFRTILQGTELSVLSGSGRKPKTVLATGTFGELAYV